MYPVVVAAFPGLLFSVQAPPRTAPAPVPVVNEYKVKPDSCSTYIYAPDAPLYYQGQPITPELLHKLGPLAAPLKYKLSQANVG